MSIWLDDLRSFFPYQDGSPVSDGQRVKSVDFRGMVVEYNASTGMLRVGPADSAQRAEVEVATTAALPYYTYATNVLTFDADGTVQIDGVDLTTNMRVLVKDEASPEFNGVYLVTSEGTVSSPAVLTRTTDFDSSGEFKSGAYMKVLSGLVNAGKNFVLSVGVGFTLDTDAVTFTEYFPQSTAIKNPVKMATVAALPANTRSGNVLTANANGELTTLIDGVTPLAGDRVLVKNEVTGANNGIYRITTLGDGSNPFQFTRDSDAQFSSQVVAGIMVPVSEGTANGNKVFNLTTNDPITLNTTSLTFGLVAGGGSSGASGLLNYSDGAGGWTGASNITIEGSGTALGFGSGTKPAQGFLRFGYVAAGGTGVPLVYVRMEGNAADCALFRWNISADVLTIGGSTATIAPVGIQLRTVGGSTSIWMTGTEEYNFSATALDMNGNNLQEVGNFDHDGTTIGFFGTTPTTKQTGVAVSAAGIHAALVTYGLIAA